MHRWGEGTRYGGTATIPTTENDVLVLGTSSDDTSSSTCTYLEVTTASDAAEYLVCTGEPHGEKWVKKLVANGAIIATTEGAARALVPKAEAMAKAGLKNGGSFAPWGAKVKGDEPSAKVRSETVEEAARN